MRNKIIIYFVKDTKLFINSLNLNTYVLNDKEFLDGLLKSIIKYINSYLNKEHKELKDKIFGQTKD